MIYLEEKQLKEVGIDWNKIIDVLEDSVLSLGENDFSQPIKPYLRYRDLTNRIIAMPAFVGGNINMSGIKWIASFPKNIDKGIPRAHSVTILNNADTGEPLGIVNSALLSVIRTASVSGLLIRHYNKIKNLDKVKVGIIGFGPIGEYHLKMCQSLLGDRLEKASLYDIRPIDPARVTEYDNVEIANSWQDAYADADIFITCTVSDAPYIDQEPKPGSLHLNASLRDYKVDVFDWFKDAMIVDDWDEVCREKTDIENMHLEKGLQREDTQSIVDVVKNNCLANYQDDQAILFNPMGMAVFDIAVGSYYYNVKKLESVEN